MSVVFSARGSGAPLFGKTQGGTVLTPTSGLMVATGGLDPEARISELALGRLFGSVKDAILNPDPEALAALPLERKLDLIRSLHDALHLAQGHGHDLVQKDPVSRFLPGRLYKALLGNLPVPGLGSENPFAQYTPRERGQLAEALYHLADAYQALKVEYPKEFTLYIDLQKQAEKPNLLDALAQGGDFQSLLASLAKKKEASSDFHTLVTPLHEAIREDLLNLGSNADPGTLAALGQGYRNVLRLAKVLNVPLEDKRLADLSLVA